MSNTKQILIAFLIPLLLAISWAILGFLVFPSRCSSTIEVHGKEVCFEYHEKFLGDEEFALMFLGLIVLSFILPPFVIMRTYQSRRNQLKTKSIIE